MQPVSATALLIDVDGTLIDNSYFHAIAWWRACRRFGIEATMAQLHRLVGMGSDTLVPALIGHENREIAAAHDAEMEPFKAEMPPCPGATDFLVEMRRRQVRVVVASSASRSDLAHLLSIVGGARVVDDVVSSSDAATSKPAPDIFAAAISRAGIAPQECIALGDTRWDVEAAARCGVECLGVLTGGWSEAELRDAGASAVYPALRELLTELDDSPLGARLRGV